MDKLPKSKQHRMQVLKETALASKQRGDSANFGGKPGERAKSRKPTVAKAAASGSKRAPSAEHHVAEQRDTQEKLGLLAARTEPQRQLDTTLKAAHAQSPWVREYGAVF